MMDRQCRLLMKMRTSLWSLPPSLLRNQPREQRRLRQLQWRRTISPLLMHKPPEELT